MANGNLKILNIFLFALDIIQFPLYTMYRKGIADKRLSPNLDFYLHKNLSLKNLVF